MFAPTLMSRPGPHAGPWSGLAALRLLLPLPLLALGPFGGDIWSFAAFIGRFEPLVQRAGEAERPMNAAFRAGSWPGGHSAGVPPFLCNSPQQVLE